MAKVDLGEKQTCPECEKKFYDLTKQPAICPYCSHSFDPNEILGAAKPEPIEEVEAQKEDGETDDDEIDEDEAAAQELELDGDSANFGNDGSGDDDGESGRAPDMDGFQTGDEDEAGMSNDDDENDALPPTDKEGEEPEEVEI